MAGSYVVTSAGSVAGLQLKAWALVSAGGVLRKSFNVASTARNATGDYTVNLAGAMADTNVVVMLREPRAQFTPGAFEVVTVAVGEINYKTYVGGVATDRDASIEVYG